MELEPPSDAGSQKPDLATGAASVDMRMLLKPFPARTISAVILRNPGCAGAGCRQTFTLVRKAGAGGGSLFVKFRWFTVIAGGPDLAVKSRIAVERKQLLVHPPWEYGGLVFFEFSSRARISGLPVLPHAPARWNHAYSFRQVLSGSAEAAKLGVYPLKAPGVVDWSSSSACLIKRTMYVRETACALACQRRRTCRIIRRACIPVQDGGRRFRRQLWPLRRLDMPALIANLLVR